MRNKETAQRGPVVRWRSIAVAATATLGLSGCLALQVDNPNSLNVENVYVNASNTEAALVGGWKRLYGAYVGLSTQNGNSNCPEVPMAVWGNAISNVPGIYYLESVAEPRVQIDNVNTLQCATRGPWYDIYSAIASGRESYQGIVNNKLQYGTVNATTPNGADTPARLIFGKFLIAMGQLNVSLRFDKVFITDVTTPVGSSGGDLKTYQEGLVQARTLLRDVITDLRAQPATFSFPSTWINGNAITRDDLIRVLQTYITRSEVYGVRTPTEAAAINWTAVIARLDSGITKDFFVQSDPAVALTNAQWIATTYGTGTGATNSSNQIRVSNRLVGPGDTSGVYQTWLATPLATRTFITITTPDRRIHGAAGNTTAGTRFAFQTTNQTAAAIAPWVTSRYRSIRYLNTAGDSSTHMIVPLANVLEQTFIRAEAYYKVGRLAEAAALINPTRIAAGLKAVDANGPPAGRDCVPRKDNGTCGDLFDAIQYEKRVENFPGAEGDIFWYDARRWGTMLSGSPLNIPVSGRELVQLGLPYYTLGGVGNAGTAP